MGAPFLTVMPAPGSMAAHDALVTAARLWRLAGAAFDAKPSLSAGKAEDAAWLIAVTHARNCGMALTQADPDLWIVRRCKAYAGELQKGFGPFWAAAEPAGATP